MRYSLFQRLLGLVVLLLACLPGLAIAEGPDQDPTPGFYQEPGVNPNRDYLAHSANERIDPFTGKLQWSFTDLSIPGNGGLALKVQRSYNSRNEDFLDPSPLGVGWTVHFGRILRKSNVAICDFNQFNPNVNPVLELPDGSRSVMYVAIGGGSFISTSRWKADCTSGHMRVYSPDGTRYEMTVAGPLVGTNPNMTQASYYPSTITDRNGNTLTLIYTGGGLNFGPQTVTASDGRSLTFTYTNGVLSTVSDGSRTWTYVVEAIPNYAGAYNLTKVIRPDGQEWRFEYNPPGSGPGVGTPGGFSMKKITYPTGGIINYTYDFVQFSAATSFPASTVVKTKVAGSDTWQYAYTPAVNPIPTCAGTLCPVHPVDDADKLDKTTVTAPDGNIYKYQHIGYASVTSGFVYLFGALMYKWTGNVQQEANSWGGQSISAQPNWRPGGVFTYDNTTSAPILFQRSINRAGSTFTTQFYDAAAPGFGFDAYGNPAKITEIGPSATGADQTRVTNLTYFIDLGLWIVHQRKDEVTDTIGSITRSFDPKGNMTAESRYGVTTNYTYTPEGDVLSKTDANLKQVTYGSYKRGVPQLESHPEAVSISRGVSNAGNVESETDGESVTTGYSYDGLSRITSITHPIGNSVTVTWGANTRTVTRGVFQEVTTFDGFGRRTSVAHSGGPETVTQTFGYDPLGRKTFVSYPNSEVGTRYTYSAADHLLTVQHTSTPTGGGATSGQGYSYANNTVAFTNERGKTFTFTYRGWGDPSRMELMKIDAPEPAATIVMTRNGLGQLTSAVQDGKTRTYGYDSRYYLTSTTEPEVGQTIFGRDGVGNMTTRTVGTTPTTTFVYDGRNRLKDVQYPAGTPSVTRTYFKDDKPAGVDNGVIRREFLYDANKNLQQEKVVIAGQNFVMGYAYDGNDALNVMTYGSGKTVTYAPDAYGRPTKAEPYVTNVAHHPTGQVKQIKYANGVQTDIALNNRMWPGTLKIAKGAQYFDTSYGYEGNGNVTTIVDGVESQYFRQMTYDNVDRLATVSGPWGAGTFTYDGRGNILSQVLGSDFSMGYNYDPTNERLNSTVGSKVYAFSYDGYGNMTGNGTTTFAFNHASQMRCARCGAGNEVAYDYDGLGLRARSTVSGAATTFIHDATGRLLWEREAGGAIKEYVYLGGHQVATRRKLP